MSAVQPLTCGSRSQRKSKMRLAAFFGRLHQAKPQAQRLKAPLVARQWQVERKPELPFQRHRHHAAAGIVLHLELIAVQREQGGIVAGDAAVRFGLRAVKLALDAPDQSEAIAANAL